MTKSERARSRKFTLRVTLASAFFSLTLMACFVLSTVTSIKVGEFIREELRLRLADSVNIMASQIDGEMHSRVKTQEDESGADYLALQAKLRELRARGTGIAGAYTMRKNQDGSVSIIVDSAPPGDGFSHAGSLYVNTTEAMMAALSAPPGTRTAFAERELSSDEFGTWISAFAPLYNAAGVMDGIVGIDASAQTVKDHENQYKLIVWLMSVAGGLVVLPLGFWFARRIREPLAQLAAEMERVKHFDLDSQVRVRSSVIEIDSMSTQLENMKRGLRSFRKYVPSDLVKDLIELDVDAELGGKKEVLTVFFSDIFNFTTMSEKMNPDVLVRFLGEYLSIVNRVLLQNNATVDKFVGDGVMAFWGAPRPISDHAVQACRAALACQALIDDLSDKWKKDGYDYNFHTRIGIHTGEVIVGNIGSPERMSYTVIGDAVNTTSRLENINKYYGTRVLITEQTWQQVQTQFATRLIDRVLVVGKTTPINIYELLATTENVSPEVTRQVHQYSLAYDLYRQRNFTESARVLERLVEDCPHDAPAQTMRDRCRAYADNPPAPDWQGEFVFASK